MFLFISFFYINFHLSCACAPFGDWLGERVHTHFSARAPDETSVLNVYTKWKCYFVDFLWRPLQIAFKIDRRGCVVCTLAGVAPDLRSQYMRTQIDKCAHEFNKKKANELNACDMWWFIKFNWTRIAPRECHRCDKRQRYISLIHAFLRAKRID